MKITIHIGSTKTGSSALQMHLFKARNCLRDEGIYYPDQGVKSNAHHILFSSVHPNAWAMHQDELPVDEKDRLQYFVRTITTILEQADKNNARNVVLSSEYWWTVLPPRFHRVIQKQFTALDVRLIACIRRQDRWLEASYLQAVKSGEDTPFDQWLSASLSDPLMGGAHYLKILNSWTEILLPVETVVIPYEFSDRTSYIKNVVGKVCDGNFGDLVVPNVASVVNKSPNKEGMDEIIKMNKDKNNTPVRGERVAAVLSSKSRPENTKKSVLMDTEEQAALLKKFECINRLIAGLYGDTSAQSPFSV